MKYTHENYTSLFIYIPAGQRIPSGRLSALPSKYIPALIYIYLYADTIRKTGGHCSIQNSNMQQKFNIVKNLNVCLLPPDPEEEREEEEEEWKKRKKGEGGVYQLQAG